MLRLLRQLFRRPPIRMGRVDNSAIRRTVIRNAQFVSFISSSGSSAHMNPDRHDRRLSRLKFMRTAGIVTLVAGFAWVAIESAEAFSIF